MPSEGNPALIEVRTVSERIFNVVAQIPKMPRVRRFDASLTQIRCRKTFDDLPALHHGDLLA